MIARLALLCLAAVALAGCKTTEAEVRQSIANGDCRIFQRPEFAVLGKRRYDQDWIDSQIESGVGGCRWARPKARPPELDGKPKAAQKPVQRPGIVQRIRERVVPVPTPAPQPVAVVPAPAPVPRDPVDDLLGQ